MKVLRKMIRIDEEKCDGCGLCIAGCPEGALQIVDTPQGPKARLVKENFCDGLGACLGDCPQDALTVEEKEAEEYDEEGVIAHIKEKSPELLEKHLKHLKEHAAELPQHHSHPEISSCPSAQMLHWEGKKKIPQETAKLTSELRQWPIQLHLVPSTAPYLQNADLVIAADCVPFACANFHQDFLRGKSLVIGCPKLDDIEFYRKKLIDISRNSAIKSITVVNMEVPCCFGLQQIVKQAIQESGKKIPYYQVVVSIKGEVM
jgi:NAD-dependent dihydropyrimidine dehydrogenase PreA subunit